MTLRRLLGASLLLTVVGALIGAYLIRVHYDMDALVCSTGDCEIVQTSSYATVMDIPIAIFGTAMYVTMLALAAVRIRIPRFTTPASAVALALTAAGTLYSGWLTWIEIYELEAICQWCVASATVTTLLLVLEVLIFLHIWSEDPEAKEELLFDPDVDA